MGISPQAAALHNRAIVIDGHSDILLPVLKGITSLTEPFDRDAQGQTDARVTRNLENVPYQLDPEAMRSAPAGQYELPLLEQGGITAQCVALFLPDDMLDTALESSLEMVAALHRAVAQHSDRCMLATSTADIRRAKAEGKVAYVLTMEGAEPIGHRIDLLDVFALLGLRMTTLTHSRRNVLADGTQQDIATGGLTVLGKRAVDRCQELGIVLDVAHLSDRGFWDVIERATQPVVCSHTSVLHPSPGYRAPWDEQNATYGMSKAEAIAKSGGLIGIVFWSMADTAELVNEADAIVAQTSIDHVALGTDFFGFRDAPRDVQHIGELPALTDALIQRGYDNEAILKLLGENWMRVFDACWR